MGLDPISQGLVYLAVSGALSFAVSKLAPKRNKSPLQDDRPPTLSARGTRVPIVIGRRKIAPIFTYSNRPQNNRCRGLHVLCLGEGDTIRRVYVDGKPAAISGGPRRRGQHSTITINNGKGIQATGEIHWGSRNQRAWNWLGNELGIDSEWPHHFMVGWQDMPVSGGIWPTIDYEVEVAPQGRSRQNIPGRGFIDEVYRFDKTLPLYDTLGVDNYRVLVDTKDFDEELFPLGSPVRIKLTSAGPTVEREVVRLGTEQTGNVLRTYVYLNDTIGTWDNTGSIQNSILVQRAGAEPVQALNQLLFALPPHGLGLDINKWDTGSILRAHNLIKNQGGDDKKKISANVLVEAKQTISQAIGLLCQDFGLSISWDPNGGPGDEGAFCMSQLYAPSEQNPPLTEIDLLTLDHQQSDAPELVTPHANPEQPTRLSFVYKDAERNYRDVPIVESAEGRLVEGEIEDAKKVSIYTATDFQTANKIAGRRFPESLSKLSTVDLDGLHEARRLIPGQCLALEGQTSVFRLISVTPDLTSDSTRLQVMVDPYGTQVSSSLLSSGKANGLSIGLSASPDRHFAIVPTGSSDEYWIPRVPTNNQSSRALVYGSVWPTAGSPSTTYNVIGESTTVQTGGEMTTSMTNVQTTGGSFTYTFNLLDVVLDLSGDSAAFNRGDQLLLVGDELMYLDAVTVNDDGTATFDNLVRPSPVAHSIGERVIIWPAASPPKIIIPATNPEVIKIKVLPYNDVSSVELDDVTAEEYAV